MVEKWLRGLTYLVVIALCLVRIYSYWKVGHGTARPTAQSIAAGLVGSRISLPGSVAGVSPKGAVLIAMTTSCVYCRRALHFTRSCS